jgi:ribosomal RNA-processing protein 17
MGRERSIDHGLGGKDTENSRQKRLKRADFQRKQALSRVKKVKNKTEIVFDDNARNDYLTGFRKRKTERRKFGLAMQIVKDQKAKKEELKERRATVAAATLGKSEDNDIDENEDENEDEDEDSDDEGDDEGDDEDGSADDKDGEAVFDDEGTTSMFGGSVSVVVAQDMSNMLDSHNHPDLYADQEAFRKKKNLTDKSKAQPLTRLERAYKKVASKNMLGKTKKVSSSNSTFDRNGHRISSKERKARRKEGKKKGGSKLGANAKQLLSKAMGSGLLGTNSYKGSAKKSRGKK